MNRFLKAAIENMERVEGRDALDFEPAQAWTQEAIAYALIAIAEMMQAEYALTEARLAQIKEMAETMRPQEKRCDICGEHMISMSTGWHRTSDGTLRCPRCHVKYSADMLKPFVSPLS